MIFVWTLIIKVQTTAINTKCKKVRKSQPSRHKKEPTQALSLGQLSLLPSAGWEMRTSVSNVCQWDEG